MASWQGWTQVPGGGRTIDAPGATGAVDVFVRGTDNRVHHNHFFQADHWSGWQPLDGLTAHSAPATASLNGSVYVFARGADNLIHFNRNAGHWEGWQPVPGGEQTDSAPAVAPGVLAVRRGDGAIRFNTFDGPGAWHGWRDVPDNGRTPSAPALTQFGAGFFLFVRGTDDGIHYKSLGSNRQSWGVWQRIPDGATPSAPAIANGLLVVRGTDDGLHHNNFDGASGWTGWQRVPGGLTRDAPTLAHSPGFFTLVVRGTDDGIHFNFNA
ncbi:hypothetical protein GJV26_25675 [Massilia dura]|uniref:PLL-like beta propeller domain-containing protein n=1 Tax=Pseudoduganella dura TaxID=321982 RepID=A0A6I3XPU6_9BURK|nr:hypothetical protein [Pseudoduganella dura]MUI15821.1 hypothetical protein [Pseudoduganella dura]GGX89627.1 hypothetical protein GCM10007386_20590 [Pseudoduganella dura]